MGRGREREPEGRQRPYTTAARASALIGAKRHCINRPLSIDTRTRLATLSLSLLLPCSSSLFIPRVLPPLPLVCCLFIWARAFSSHFALYTGLTFLYRTLGALVARARSAIRVYPSLFNSHQRERSGCFLLFFCYYMRNARVEKGAALRRTSSRDTSLGA